MVNESRFGNGYFSTLSVKQQHSFLAFFYAFWIAEKNLDIEQENVGS